MPTRSLLLAATTCLVVSLATATPAPGKGSSSISSSDAKAVERALEQYRALAGSIEVPLEPDVLDNKHDAIEAFVVASFWQQEEQRAQPETAAHAAAQLSEWMCAEKAALVARNEAAIAQHNTRVTNEARLLLTRAAANSADEYHQQAQRVIDETAGRMFAHTRDVYLRELDALATEVESAVARANLPDHKWPWAFLSVCAGVCAALLVVAAVSAVVVCARRHSKLPARSSDGTPVEQIEELLHNVPVPADSMEIIAA